MSDSLWRRKKPAQPASSPLLWGAFVHTLRQQTLSKVVAASVI